MRPTDSGERAVRRLARTRTYLTPPRLSSLDQQRAQLRGSSRDPVVREDGDRTWRAWGLSERPWPLGISAARGRWEVVAYGVDPPEARRAARAYFSLGHPLEGFYRKARLEPALAPAVRRFRGLRMPRDPSLWESLFHSVIGQQISVAAANALKRRLVERVGSFFAVDGAELPFLPPPRMLRTMGAEELGRAGLSRAKTRTVLALAAAGTSRIWEPLARQEAPLGALITRLDAAPGVGVWTAENAVLRGSSRTDVFVAGDLGVRSALARFGPPSAAASEEAARRWADRWYRDWGSYATLYLWRRWVTEGGRAA